MMAMQTGYQNRQINNIAMNINIQINQAKKGLCSVDVCIIAT